MTVSVASDWVPVFGLYIMCWMHCITCWSAFSFQQDTFADFQKMTDKLVEEILFHMEVYSSQVSRIRWPLFT